MKNHKYKPGDIVTLKDQNIEASKYKYEIIELMRSTIKPRDGDPQYAIKNLSNNDWHEHIPEDWLKLVEKKKLHSRRQLT